jgi:hypothetical protein
MSTADRPVSTVMYAEDRSQLASLRRGIDCLSGCWRIELDQSS